MLHEVQETISNLVEANSPSNATALNTAIPQSEPAPPASENAMAKLERQIADEKMRAKGCAICLEQVEEVLILPCKHWYCDKCITAWLLQERRGRSQTCPECRQPIETTSESHNGLDVQTTASGGMQIISRGTRNVHMSNVNVGHGGIQAILFSNEDVQRVLQLMRERV